MSASSCFRDGTLYEYPIQARALNEEGEWETKEEVTLADCISKYF